MFFDLKRRTPRLDEIIAWHDRTHDEMVASFLKDEETWASWFEDQLFYFLLLDQFRPKEGRLTTLPARLTARKTTVPMALQEIVRSQYFGARNPGNDTFVTVVLEQCLGLVVQERKNLRVLETGKKMYDGYRMKLYKEAKRFWCRGWEARRDRCATCRLLPGRPMETASRARPCRREKSGSPTPRAEAARRSS